MYRWSIKPTVHTGTDSLKRLGSITDKHIFFVCDSFLKDSKNLKMITENLGENNKTFFYYDIIPDPPIESITKGIESLQNEGPNLVIAVGGGSCIDTAKSMIYFFNKLSNRKITNFIAIPTTSGTGSEVSSFAVITDITDKIKYPLSDKDLIPDEAILDSRLVLTCPASITAYSGLDTLTHSLESLMSTNSNSFTEALAEKSIKIVYEHLSICVHQGDNLESRQLMHEASCLAGMAFDSSGLGICHAIAHQVGALFKIPHGLANAMLLPYVVEFNCNNKEIHTKISELSKSLKVAPSHFNNSLATQRLIKSINKLVNDCNCPNKLSKYGVDKADALAKAEVIAHKALKDITLQTNPIKPSLSEVVNIYKKII